MNFGEENLSSWLISTTIPCHVNLNSDIFYLSSYLLQKYCSANVRIKVVRITSIKVRAALSGSKLCTTCTSVRPWHRIEVMFTDCRVYVDRIFFFIRWMQKNIASHS